VKACPVRAASSRLPQRKALEFEGQSWTWEEVERAVEAWTSWLATRGIGPGHAVTTLAWNCPELVFLFFALLRRHASLIPLNARLTKAELEPLVRRAGSGLVLADETLSERIPQSERFPQLRVDASSMTQPALVDETAIAASLFTSGTTGTPSLISLSVGNFLASAVANASNLGSSESQVWLGVLPLFHVGGLSMLFRCVEMGGMLWMERHFDADRIAALLTGGVVTHASFVPTALSRVLDAMTMPVSSSIEAILVGGGPMGRALLSRARSMGLPVLQTYGLTEACSQVTTERPLEADGTTAGHPLKGVEVRVVDTQLREVRVGVVGQVLVRGPTVTKLAGEWLMTNDLGSLDERGRLTIHARRKDLIVSGGENVYPAEVEAALLESGLVEDVVVMPQADETWGQIPVALVVWRNSEAIDELMAFASERLASFKRPRRILSVSSLPRNATGKLQRHEIEIPPICVGR
jgi:O-succinylbenzoic acid--CoA ligase